MPEAAMNEENLPMPGEDDVRFSWQMGRVEPEAVPHPV